MDLWHLKVFQRVVELKGFSKAAKSVNLTQPTISSHIKELENYFGCQLIDRLGKQALPTKAGELLYSYATRISALFAETESAMNEFLGKISGHLVIGGSTIPGGYILPPVIGAFVNRHKNVNISLKIGDTAQIIEDILAYKVEIGMVGAKAESPNIIQRKLIEDTLGLIVPADHKWAKLSEIDMDMLEAEPFIIREGGSGTRKSIQESFSRSGLTLDGFHIVAEMGSTEAVIQGIKHQVGVSILSPIAVKEDLISNKLKSLAVRGLDLKQYFYLTFHKDRTPSPLCRAFMEFLETRFAPKSKA